MIRKLLQSALCLILCPLLVAQQLPPPAMADDTPRSMPEFVTITKDSVIELMLLDSISSETSKRGDLIHFLVEKDLVVNGIVVIHAGTVITGVVTKATKAVRGKRYARIDYKPLIFESVKHQKLDLTRSLPRPPGPPKSRAEKHKDVKRDLRTIVLAPLVIPMFPILIGMTIGMWNEGGKPNGAEVKDDACIEQFWFTKSAVTIRVADLPAASLNAASATTPCKVIPASKRALVVTPQAAVTTENPIPQAH